MEVFSRYAHSSNHCNYHHCQWDLYLPRFSKALLKYWYNILMDNYSAWSVTVVVTRYRNSSKNIYSYWSMIRIWWKSFPLLTPLFMRCVEFCQADRFVGSMVYHGTSEWQSELKTIVIQTKENKWVPIESNGRELFVMTCSRVLNLTGCWTGIQRMQLMWVWDVGWCMLYRMLLCF